FELGDAAYQIVDDLGIDRGRRRAAGEIAELPLYAREPFLERAGGGTRAAVAATTDEAAGGETDYHGNHDYGCAEGRRSPERAARFGRTRAGWRRASVRVAPCAVLGRLLRRRSTGSGARDFSGFEVDGRPGPLTAWAARRARRWKITGHLEFLGDSPRRSAILAANKGAARRNLAVQELATKSTRDTSSGFCAMAIRRAP